MDKLLTLSNHIEDIPKLAEFVDIICEELGIDMALNFNLNLVLEEAVSNVMLYAFPQNEEHTISLKAKTEDDMLAFELSDQGKEFDPISQAPEVDTTLSVEERQIGGLGIFLIQQIMDVVSYERKDDSNILTMKIKLVKE